MPENRIKQRILVAMSGGVDSAVAAKLLLQDGGLMWELDIVQARKVAFSGRKKFSNIFSNHSNVVVSHQLLNALNYTYLEALHFNIPLVHNSEFIKGAGYYYPDYETKKGAKALYDALTFHDKNLEEYKASAKIVLDRYSPHNEKVKDKYKRMLS